MLMLPLQNQNMEATSTPPPYSTANISTLHANPQRSQPSQTNQRQDPPPKQDEIMASVLFSLATICIFLSILILTWVLLIGRDQVFISIPVTNALNVTKPKAQDISQDSTVPILSVTTEFDCLEKYLKEPEFKHKKIEGSFDFLRFKTALVKLEYYASGLQSSNCPHLNIQNVGQILTFNESCHSNDLISLRNHFDAITCILIPNFILLIFGFMLHIGVHFSASFGIFFLAVPWTITFGLHLTATIFNYKLNDKFRSLRSICFQPNVVVTGTTSKFKYIIIVVAVLYVIEFIFVLASFIRLVILKRAKKNNDEALQEIG